MITFEPTLIYNNESVSEEIRDELDYLIDLLSYDYTESFTIWDDDDYLQDCPNLEELMQDYSIDRLTIVR